MALGFNTSSAPVGDILPTIRFDAKAGDLLRVDRTQDAMGDWQTNIQDMLLPQEIVFDFENMEVGYMHFEKGQAPSFAMVKVGGKMPERPSENHNQGFRIRVANSDLGLREFCGNSKTLLGAMDKLHDEYVAESRNNPGKMALVSVDGTNTVEVNTPKGTLRFKAPEWRIAGWVDAPSEFDGGSAEAPAQNEEEPLF